jgi:hypothetical protein
VSTPPRSARPTSPTTAEWRLQPFWERAFLAIAAATLLLPAFGSITGLGRDGDVAERPDAATTAEADADTAANVQPLQRWARRFEDDFAFRGAFVRAQAVVRYAAFGVSPQPEVIRGRDGWWFYADNGGVDDYLSTAPLTDAELDHWGRALQHTQDWLASRGIAYVFTIAPDKHQVYPEEMPASLRPASTTSRADQLLAHLAAHTSVHALDLRPALMAAKAHERIYHRTDSHWNDRGALIAARAILARIRHLAPAAGWRPDGIDAVAFDRLEQIAPGMDLARMLRLEGVLSEVRLDLVPRVARAAVVIEPVDADPDFGEPRVVTERPDGRGPRAVVYRDSFGSGLIPFLAEEFGRAVFLWEYDVNTDTIETERPDVVIHEWASRRLHTRGPFDPIAVSER